jgi:ABC-type lipoprotein export system ATPase subunit
MVSPDLPLRVNLTARENASLSSIYMKNMTAQRAGSEADELLKRLGYPKLGHKRASDMNAEENFVAMLARAIMLRRSRLIIDRPGAMLYDVPYPAFIRSLHDRLADGQAWEILDFDWNRPLYES